MGRHSCVVVRTHWPLPSYLFRPMPEPQVVMPVSQAGRRRTMHLVEFEQILCLSASFGSHCGARSGGSVEMTFNSVFLVPNSQEALCSRRAGAGGGR